MQRVIVEGLARAWVASLVLAACVPMSEVEVRTASRPAEPSRPVAQFPALAQVDQVVLGPVPDLAPLLGRSARQVDAWQLESEPAPGDPVYEAGDDPFEAVLDRVGAAQSVPVQRSASLRCVAREVARFYVEHDGLPGDRLTQFLLAACGSSVVDYQLRTSGGEVTGNMPLERLVGFAAEGIEQNAAASLSDDRIVGFGMHRRGRRVVFAIVSARPRAQLVPWETVNALGEVHLQGRLSGPGDALVATVNQGAFGFARCRIEPMVALPDFDVRCPLAEGDDTALVRLDVMTVGRVLGRPAAQLLLRRDAGARPVFQAPRSGAEGEDLAAALVARLNEVRQAAGLAPVRLAPRETETHRRVAPYAAYALMQRDEAAQDMLALGLLAGWGVEGGTIRDASQLVDVAIGTTSAADWVAAALERPTGRVALLSPDAQEVAVGAVAVSDPPAVAAVVSTYSFFEGVDHGAAAERVLERVERERVARGLPPPRRMDGLEVLRAHAAEVAAGRMVPSEALQRGLNAESQRRRRPLQGLQLETVSLEHARLPDALFAGRDLGLGVAVAHTRAPGAAWGQYVVYFVFDR